MAIGAAADVNRQIARGERRDVEAMNRLGKALMEMAISTRQSSLPAGASLDSSNVIAQRNAGRLEQLISAKAASCPGRYGGSPRRQCRSGQCLCEEVGKTFVTDLSGRPLTPS